MKDLVLTSDKANIYSNILRFVFGTVGLLYSWMGFSQFFSTTSLTTQTVLDLVLGTILIVAAVFKPTFGANIKLELNDEFIRATEDGPIIRTVYWSKLKKVGIGPFNLRLYYPSGTAESFRLPYLSSKDHEILHQHIRKKAEKYQFEVKSRPWWKLS